MESSRGGVSPRGPERRATSNTIVGVPLRFDPSPVLHLLLQFCHISTSWRKKVSRRLLVRSLHTGRRSEGIAGESEKEEVVIFPSRGAFPERFPVLRSPGGTREPSLEAATALDWLTGGRFINYFRKKGGKVFPITVFCEGLPRATRQGVRLMATRAHRSSPSPSYVSSSSSTPLSTSSSRAAVSLPILQGPPTPPTRYILFLYPPTTGHGALHLLLLLLLLLLFLAV